jgi:hypothetical protein
VSRRGDHDEFERVVEGILSFGELTKLTFAVVLMLVEINSSNQVPAATL